MKSRFLITVIALAYISLVISCVSALDNFLNSINCAGETIISNNFVLTNSMGQSVVSVNKLESASYENNVGFQYLISGENINPTPLPSPTETPAPTSIPTSTPVQGLVNIGLSPEISNLYIGDSFEIEIWIHAADQEINSVDAHLNFDPDYIQVDSITGINLPGWIQMQSIFSNSTGTIDYAGVNLSGSSSGDFLLCTLYLNALNINSGSRLEFVFSPINRETRAEYDGINYCNHNVTDALVVISDFGILNGLVEREWCTPPNCCSSITVVLCSEGSENSVYNVDTDCNGEFSIVVEPGLYDVLVSGIHSVANLIENIEIPAGATTETIDFGTLHEGDANNDNYVTSLDFFIIKNSYNTSVGDPNFDFRADFNEDDYVTSTDFYLLKRNYNLAGDTCLNKSNTNEEPSWPKQITAISDLKNVLIDFVQSAPESSRECVTQVWVRSNEQTFDVVDLHLNFNPKSIQIDSIIGINAAGWVEMQKNWDNQKGSIDYAVVNFEETSSDILLCILNFTRKDLLNYPELEFTYEPTNRNTRVEYNGTNLLKKSEPTFFY